MKKTYTFTKMYKDMMKTFAKLRERYLHVLIKYRYGNGWCRGWFVCWNG